MLAKRQIKDACKRFLFCLHKLALRLKVHIIPVHYYSPVPNIIELEKSRDVWARKSDMPGIHISLEEQVSNMKEICMPFQHEYNGAENYMHAVSHHFGPGFGYIESQALHAVIRHYKPGNVIEIGSGVSTFCALEALKMNREEAGKDFKLTCIEPYPSKSLKALNPIKLITSKVQTVDMDVYETLKDGDLLFIDSSHIVKAGADVNHLILEVLPRIKAKIIVHFHDINFPYDYQRMILKTFFHFSEMSLLRAYLIHNSRAKIIFCLSHLHYERKDALSQVFPDYVSQGDHIGMRMDSVKSFSQLSEHFPSSIYISLS